MQLENLPNEIFFDCFEYFHSFDCLYSFDQLNDRFNQLFRKLSWHLNLEQIDRLAYDVLCRYMLHHPDVQQQVYSLRLSDEKTPGIINDFLSKFSLDQFAQLHSLTLKNLHQDHIKLLKIMLPKLSQITTLYVLDSEIELSDLVSVLPIDNLQTLSIDSNLYFVTRTIPIIRLTLSALSLNDLCRLFAYTPLLQYLNTSCISSEILRSEYRDSHRPVDLQKIIFGDFRAEFIDLSHCLQNMSKLRDFTIGSSNDEAMLDASRWERLIKHSLPSLLNFRFRLTTNHRSHLQQIYKRFHRFQRKFWLEDHQWYTECLIKNRRPIIYTNPYPSECGPIPLTSKRYTNPLIDHSQTFKHVHDIVLSPNDLFEHGDYYFPNVTSLTITRSLQVSTENEEERVLECLMNLMNFTHLKHLEFPLDCQIQRPSLLFRILELAPQLSSFRTKPCLFNLLENQPIASRYLNGKIRKLDLTIYTRHSCRKLPSVQSVYQLIPNLEQLTIPIDKQKDWLFLLNEYSYLKTFHAQFKSRVSPKYLNDFSNQASNENILYSEIITKSRARRTHIYNVWKRKILK